VGPSATTQGNETSSLDAFMRRLLRLPAGVDAGRTAEKAFGTSLLISTVRCLLTYVLLPLLKPVLDLTGGVGPWLPFQMIAAGYVGMLAGLLPQWRGRAEIAMLASYGAVAGYVYGLLLNLSFWPFTTGYGTGLSFDPAASTWENTRTFLLYTLATSMGFDTGRALTTAVLIVLAGPGVLVVLRRASRRAHFEPQGAARPTGDESLGCPQAGPEASTWQ
jgi:hypothetical protein